MVRLHRRLQPPFLPRHVPGPEEAGLRLVGPGSVDQYEAAFSAASRFYPEIWENEKLRSERFFRGLRKEIRDCLPLVEGYDRLVDTARQMAMSRNLPDPVRPEPLRRKEYPRQRAGPSRRGPDQRQQNRARPYPDTRLQQQQQPQPPKLEAPPSGRRNDRGCFHCGSLDHWVRECPKAPPQGAQRTAIPPPPTYNRRGRGGRNRGSGRKGSNQAKVFSITREKAAEGADLIEGAISPP